MELNELMAQIEMAYNRYSESLWKYRTKAMEVRAAEYDLEGAKLALYRDGKVEGKNQTERDACVAELLANDIGRHEAEKQDEAELYMLMELNKLAVEKWRAILRIEELGRLENER